MPNQLVRCVCPLCGYVAYIEPGEARAPICPNKRCTFEADYDPQTTFLEVQVGA